MPTVSKTVYMPVELAGDVEEAAKERDQSDSEFMREAARRELQREEHNDD